MSEDVTYGLVGDWRGVEDALRCFAQYLTGVKPELAHGLGLGRVIVR